LGVGFGHLSDKESEVGEIVLESLFAFETCKRIFCFKIKIKKSTNKKLARLFLNLFSFETRKRMVFF